MPKHNTETRSLSFEISERFLADVASAVGEHYRTEFDSEYPREVIETALRSWLDRKVDLILEEAAEVLTRPGTIESAEFSRGLRQMAGAEQTAEVEELHPMFSGYRNFSPQRLTAMMGYFAAKGIDLYKTKLNKLLFYADLTGFYLTGRGISGAQYVHLPYGPVPDAFEEMIDLAAKTGMIAGETFAVKDATAMSIRAGAKDARDFLNDEDRRVIDWVTETYGGLSTTEITDRSHNEMAYKNTRPGEKIAYRYAEFLNILPPKDLLD